MKRLTDHPLIVTNLTQQVHDFFAMGLRWVLPFCRNGIHSFQIETQLNWQVECVDNAMKSPKTTHTANDKAVHRQAAENNSGQADNNAANVAK